MVRRADQRKFHYIYKITRIDGSGKYYIGMHSTDDLDDGYFGSGSLLSKSIKKHGKEKHHKEVLEFLPSREALKFREKEIVNEELLGDELCMNLMLGGEGGCTGCWAKPEYRIAQSNGVKKKWEDPEYRKACAEGSRKTMHRNLAAGKMKSSGFAGKKHNQETINLLKTKKIGHGVGSTNSQFGKRWIMEVATGASKRIDKDEQVPEGYVVGRKMKLR